MKITISLITSILLSSCSSIDTSRIGSNYVTAFNSLKGSIFGFEDYPISRKLVDNIPYASMKLKIGKGSSGLLILETIQGQDYTYVSADGVRFMLKNGKITKTSNLPNNLIDLVSPKSFLVDFIVSEQDTKTFISYYSYDEPELYDLRVKVLLKKQSYEEVFVLEKKMNLLRIDETLKNDYLGWEVTNSYWISNDNFVWKSKQHISPLLPEVLYEITKKPVN